MDYDKLAKAIYDITGPAANIEKAYNCMTRLRLTVKDEHFTKEDLAKLPGVMGINKSGDEWQIVVGPGKATKLYQAFAPLGLTATMTARVLSTARPCMKKYGARMQRQPSWP